MTCLHLREELWVCTSLVSLWLFVNRVAGMTCGIVAPEFGKHAFVFISFWNVKTPQEEFGEHWHQGQKPVAQSKNRERNNGLYHLSGTSFIPPFLQYRDVSGCDGNWKCSFWSMGPSFPKTNSQTKPPLKSCPVSRVNLTRSFVLRTFNSGKILITIFSKGTFLTLHYPSPVEGLIQNGFIHMVFVVMFISRGDMNLHVR